jgi:hypothetical protein
VGFSWVATEARTGIILADLPNLNVQTVKGTVGRYETVSGATLPINAADAPADWVRATKKNASHLVLLADNPSDPAHGIPVIGYRITRRTRDETDLCKLDLATLESYLDCRFVGNETYAAVGQNDIFADLITKYILDGGLGGTSGKNGIPIRVQYTTSGPGKARDRSWTVQDDKTIYSIVTDMAGVIGGFEWYIGFEWQHNPERLTPVAYVGDRVGSPVMPGLKPAVTFEMPGPDASFQLVEDYSQGKGANEVIAVSSGVGASRPQSLREAIADPDQPTVEWRYTPSTSIIDVATLNAHATQTVAAMAGGAAALSLVITPDDGTQFGIDWNLGDDVGYNVGGLDAAGIDRVPAFPGGIEGVARAAGFELTPSDTTTLTPVLVSPSGDFDGI